MLKSFPFYKGRVLSSERCPKGHMAGGKEGLENNEYHSKPMLCLLLLCVKVRQATFPIHCSFWYHTRLTPEAPSHN